MADPAAYLEAFSPVANVSIETRGVRLRNLPESLIFSIGVPRASKTMLADALMTRFGLELPGPSRSTGGDRCRLIWMTPDQYFLILPENGSGPGILRDLRKIAYVTDQSDAWVGLEIAGKDVREILGRTCPLDLHLDRFKLNAATRTLMEHLAIIIIRTGSNTFQLFSARSSGYNFVAAITQSIENVT